MANVPSSGYESDHEHQWMRTYPDTRFARIHCSVLNCQTSMEEPSDDFWLPGESADED